MSTYPIFTPADMKQETGVYYLGYPETGHSKKVDNRKHFCGEVKISTTQQMNKLNIKSDENITFF